MSNKLEIFVQDNRAQFDLLTPPQIMWANVNAGRSSSGNGLLSGLKGWKLFLMITVPLVAIAAIIGLQNSHEPGASTSAIVPIENETKQELKETATNVVTVTENEAAQSEAAQSETPIIESDKTNVKIVKSKVETRPSKKKVIKTDEEELVSVIEPDVDTIPQPSIEPVEPPAPIELDIVAQTTVTETDYVRSEVDTTKTPFEFSKTFEGIKRIEVSGIFCNVNFKNIKGMKLSVDGVLKLKSKRKYGFKYKQQGDILEINVKPLQKKRGFNIRVENALLELGIPSSVKELVLITTSGDISGTGFDGNKMNLNTTSGNIEVNSIAAAAKLESYSGNIKLAELQGDLKAASTSGNQNYESISGESNINAYSGNVYLEKANGDVNVSTTSGNNKLKDINGKVKLETYSGNAKIYGVEGNVKANTTSGNLEVKNVTGKLDLTSYSGDITLVQTRGSLAVETTSGSIDGTAVEVAEKVKLNTYSGDIEIAFTNPMSDLQFNLSTYSGDVIIKKDGTNLRGGKQLSAGAGKIMVKGVSTSGDQEYK